MLPHGETMTELKPNLLPCPFCGGKAWEHVDKGSIICGCFNCGARISRALVPPASWWNAVFACRDAWNRRKEDEDE